METERARQLLQTAKATRNPVIELREARLRGLVDSATRPGAYGRVALQHGVDVFRAKGGSK